jgi:hypothetical protein
MILTVIIIIAIAISMYFALKKAPLIDDEGNLVKENPVEPITDATNIEVKAESISESSEELAKRLDKISNPDKNKPFAKISTPDSSEMVIEPVVAKKKAPKKPKAPKPSIVDETSGEVNVEEAAPKKKRYYKKRAPKKAE